MTVRNPNGIPTNSDRLLRAQSLFGDSLRRVNAIIILFCLTLVSCVQDAGGLKRTARATSPDETSTGGGGTPGGEDNKNAGENTTGGSTSLSTATSSQLRHIVDPFDGSYKTKVAIPKNFTGLLFLSGINITALSDRLISVRFNFGRDLEPVTIEAVVGRAPGLTPQTDTEVLILDMNNRPFENIRLLYDLYDYNDYRDDADPTIETKTPTDDPRNVGLYCRGLKLEHDPTFLPGNNNSQCDGIVACPFSVDKCDGGNICSGNSSPNTRVVADTQGIYYLDALANKCYKHLVGNTWQEDVSAAGSLIVSPSGEKCLYAYAKIKDKGLVDESNQVAFNPTLPQIDISGGGYSTDSKAQSLDKCLPGIVDATNSAANLQLVLNAKTITAGSLSYGSTVTMQDDSTYKYRGPFRAIDSAAWEIQATAAFSNIATGSAPIGLFQKFLADPAQAASFINVDGGYNSFIFPRMGKMELQANVSHFSSTNPFTAVKTQTTLPSNGFTSFMGGCNLRVSNHDSFTNEGLSSCNVTATIEILAKDPDTGDTVTVGDPSKELKLQLIRPSATDFEGKEVLFTSLKTCETSNGCGGDECCFNNRCWDKSLVSQCKEDAPVVGNGGIGAKCSSDYECSSLCCNQNTATCAVHINTATEAVFCSKSPGQQCVAEEFCRVEQVPTCQITKTGLSATGQVQCALRCFNIPTNGSCINGLCQIPNFPDPPNFDANAPDCSNACDPPVPSPTGNGFLINNCQNQGAPGGS